MNGTFRDFWRKLRLATLLSSLFVALVPASADEVAGTIAGFRMIGDTLELDLELDAEALVSGLAGGRDAGNGGEAVVETYAGLRGLPPALLEQRLRDVVEGGWLDGLVVDAGGRVALTVSAIEIPETGDVDIPRRSHLVLAGDVPRSAVTVTFGWPGDAGPLTLRQREVAAPHSVSLGAGMTSPPIPLDGGALRGPGPVLAEHVKTGVRIFLVSRPDHVLFAIATAIFAISAGGLSTLLPVSAGAFFVALFAGAVVDYTGPSILHAPLLALSLVGLAVLIIVSGRSGRWHMGYLAGVSALHGVVLAAWLLNTGIPRGQGVAASAGFGLGAVLALMAVFAACVLVAATMRRRAWFRPRVVVPASALMAAAGAWLLLQGWVI